MLKVIQWQHIKKLIDCDTKLLGIENKLTIINKSIEEKKQIDMLLAKQIQEKQRLLVNKQKEFDENKLRLAELQENLAQKQGLLDQVKKQKEYKSLEHEIQSIEEEAIVLEEHMNKQGLSIDTIKQEISSLLANQTQKHDLLIQENTESEKNMALLQSNIATYQNERKTLIETLPAEWVSTYERMRQSVQDPLVPAINACCSACFYAIPHQDFSWLKKSSIVMCRNCYRFLYYDKETEATTSEQKF